MPKLSERLEAREGDVKRPSVFICHKRDAEPDDGIAKRLAEDLKPLCEDLYLDLDRPGGEEFAKVIEEKLNHADIVIALVSVNSIKSQWFIAELESADELNREHLRPRIIPVRLGFTEPYPIAIKPYLRRFDAISFKVYPQNIYSDKDYSDLIRRLKENIGGVGPPTPPGPIDDRARRRWLLWLALSIIITSVSAGLLPGLDTFLPKLLPDTEAVATELRATGLLDKIKDAHGYFVGSSNHFDTRTALEIYREVDRLLPAKALMGLNRKLLEDARRSYLSDNFNNAVSKYDDLFAPYLLSR